MTRRNKFKKYIFCIINCISLFICVLVYLNINIILQDRHHYRDVHLSGNSENTYIPMTNTIIDDFDQRYDKNKMNNLLNQILENKCSIMYDYGLSEDDDGNMIGITLTNQNAFNACDYSVSSGRLFNTSDFNYADDNEIPILIGNELSNKYQLGGSYLFNSPGNGKQFKVKVIGILSKHTLDYCLQANPGTLLDSSYIIPINNYYINNYFGAGDYEMGLSCMKVENQNKNSITKIEQELNKSELYDLTFIPIKNGFDPYYTYFIERWAYLLILDVILGTAILINIIFRYILSINWR